MSAIAPNFCVWGGGDAWRGPPKAIAPTERERLPGRREELGGRLEEDLRRLWERMLPGEDRRQLGRIIAEWRERGDAE